MIHLKKLAVGVDDLDHLERFQSQRIASLKAQGLDPTLYTYTRNMPRRSKEILQGGSIYWILKGVFCAHQQIIGFRSDKDEEGRNYCHLLLDPELVKTERVAHKPFQGWRYLEPHQAPKDLRDQTSRHNELPDHMISELKELGLL